MCFHLFTLPGNKATTGRICQQVGGIFLLMMMIFAVGFLGGCAGLRSLEMPPLPENVPAAYELAGVPFFPQQTYQCGPAALAAALDWSGLSVRPEDLAAEVYTPSLKGSLQTALVAATRRHGRIAYEIYALDQLVSEIAAGHPVIILQNLGISWYPVWHYAVVIGYNQPEGDIILRSGVDPRKLMPFGVFEKTWSRADYWGLLVLKPTQMPATAKEEVYLNAVLGLEKAGQFRLALSGYQNALTRWPQSLPALMGLGNSYYALGDLKNSEQAFREAARLHPEAGPAYNNLAQVLLEQGRKDGALKAARKAVLLGGPLVTVYQQTLKEIEAAISK
jgi:tetratricopeptide (TPR) repeat protein